MNKAAVKSRFNQILVRTALLGRMKLTILFCHPKNDFILILRRSTYLVKIQRTKNAGRNIVFGTVLKVYNIVIPFLMRTLMIYQMGMEYAGLNNLFSSLFQVLNLAELGIGAALTFSMYEPIAKDESEKISALLNLYRKCFQIIGGIIFALGLLCMPFH